VRPPSAAPPEAPAPALPIRPATPGDLAAVAALVQAIANETYGHLFRGDPPRPEGKWALLALQGERLVGVVVADDDWIEDLWVVAEFRGQGLGRRLLGAGEARIAAAGHELAHLRVIAENQDARRFYARCGWSEVETYPHETWGFPMVDMIKRVGTGSSAGGGVACPL
jgi:GNAT superfamily N-acetyltransferase